MPARSRDGLFLALAPALWALRGFRPRAQAAGLALAAFTLVFAPWPLRNLNRFGQVFLAGRDQTVVHDTRRRHDRRG